MCLLGIKFFTVDPIDSCLRMRCECDLDLAKRFSSLEDTWNEENHRRWGETPFECRAHYRQPTQSSSSNELQHSIDRIGFESDEEITERNESEKSTSVFVHGEVLGCCGRAPNVRYFRQGQKCCSDGQVTDENAPCNVDIL